MIFLNDFFGSQAQKFKFADDSSVIVTGKDPSELSVTLRKACSDIEKWSDDWRMLVNGGKTELFLFNSEANDVELPSLGVIIDSKLNYGDHSTEKIEKTKRNWKIS